VNDRHPHRMADPYKTGPDGARRVRVAFADSRKTRMMDANTADYRSALPAMVTQEKWEKPRAALAAKEKRERCEWYSLLAA
jgi:hypothetical protein